MLTAFIVDDEAKGRLALREKLTTYCSEVSIVGEAVDGPAAIQGILQLQPQLIFLDIEMPQMNGFEMLNALPEKNFHIIFTTAYDQYAIQAIRYAAFDYLLKPVDIEELQLAIAKLTQKQSIETKRQVEVLQQNIRQPIRQWTKLAIPTLDGVVFYDIQKIVHLEASSNYTNIFLDDQTKITASKTLKEFEEMLPMDLFFRTHHSHMINLSYVKRYIKGDGGQIELTTGKYVDLARRKKDDFFRITGI
jgi:two-component system, LytTR family, response regulator